MRVRGDKATVSVACVADGALVGASVFVSGAAIAREVAEIIGEGNPLVV